MLVPARYRAPIESGAVSVLFRRWTRCQVVAGHVYRTSAGRLEVLKVERVDPDRITKIDAKRAGFADPDGVRGMLSADPTVPTYRIRIRPVDGPDPRSELAAADDVTPGEVAELDRRLDRLDKASAWGAWTAATLRLVEAHPATLAGDLASSVGRERAPFKLDVRKLKNLGLTESLRVGYRLSPRGRAYLRQSARSGG